MSDNTYLRAAGQSVTDPNVQQAAGPYRSDHENPDLADRNALRRVPGLGTDLVDVTEVEYRQLRLERVLLVGVWTQGSLVDAEQSLVELGRLAETAGSAVLQGVVQHRARPDPATYIGSGKARHLRDVVLETGADTVICDGELSLGQLRQLEDIVKVKVIDRTALILDIFAQHARSREGKAQVELAQLAYMLPRLRGWGEAMSRAGAGIGTRGPGETKIETDRRRIRDRMARLRREIASMSTSRQTMRLKRVRQEVPSVAIAGYTNAGKSSLLNSLTGAGVLVQDALFATLDPTVRRSQTTDGRVFTLTDTVGFVRHLPHQLIDAFRSTLEEVNHAQLILHVVDGSEPDPQGQIQAVHEVLRQIDAADIPEIIVVNKIDAAEPDMLARIRSMVPHAVLVSAATGFGIEGLRTALAEQLPTPEVTVAVLVPYDRGDLVSKVYATGEVMEERQTADGTLLHARVGQELAGALSDYSLESFIVDSPDKQARSLAASYGRAAQQR